MRSRYSKIQRGGMTALAAMGPGALVTGGPAVGFNTAMAFSNSIGSINNPMLPGGVQRNTFDNQIIVNPWAATESGATSTMFAATPLLGELLANLPDPNSMTATSPGPEAVFAEVTNATTVINNVGSAALPTTVSFLQDAMDSLDATSNPTMSDIVSVKNVVDKTVCGLEDKPLLEAAAVTEEMVINMGPGFRSPTLPDSLAQAVAQVQTQLRSKASIAASNGDVVFHLQFDSVRKDLQQNGAVTPIGLAAIMEMYNELQVCEIVEPQVRWASASLFWVKELAKSSLNKGGEHAKSFTRFLNDYVVPAVKSVQDSLAPEQIQWAGQTLHQTMITGTDEGWYNAAMATPDFHNAPPWPSSTAESGGFFGLFQTGANSGWQWATRQFAEKTAWAHSMYANNRAGFEFAGYSGLHMLLGFSSVFIIKYLGKKLNTTMRNVLYGRLRKAKDGQAMLRIVYDDGTAESIPLENPDSMLNTASSESALSFDDKDTPVQKGEKKTAMLAITWTPMNEPVLASASPGVAEIIEDMKKNPELANQVLDQIDVVPVGTTVPVTLPNGPTIEVDPHEVKKTVDVMVNNFIAHNATTTNDKTVAGVLANKAPEIQKQVVNILNQGPTAVASVLNAPENDVKTTEVKKAIEQITTTVVIPELNEKKEDKQVGIETGVIPPPPVARPTRTPANKFMNVVTPWREGPDFPPVRPPVAPPPPPAPVFRPPVRPPVAPPPPPAPVFRPPVAPPPPPAPVFRPPVAPPPPPAPVFRPPVAPPLPPSQAFAVSAAPSLVSRPFTRAAARRSPRKVSPSRRKTPARRRSPSRRKTPARRRTPSRRKTPVRRRSSSAQRRRSTARRRTPSRRH